MKRHRCSLCRKKLKAILPFACKCEKYFCYLHKMPHDHKCTYDHVSEYKKQLDKQNEKVEHTKMEYM